MSTLRKNGKIVTWDNFCERFNNYILNNFRHSEDLFCIVTDLEDPITDFRAINIPEDLTEDKEKITFK